MAREMTIGALAKAAGVGVETIRYYHRLGLIHEPEKPSGGQRRYSDASVRDLAFIRRAQQLGFTLAEIKELLRLAAGSDRRAVRRIAEQRLARLALQAKQLSGMRRALGRLLAQSKRRQGRGCDPIIAALRGEPQIRT